MHKNDIKGWKTCRLPTQDNVKLKIRDATFTTTLLIYRMLLRILWKEEKKCAGRHGKHTYIVLAVNFICYDQDFLDKQNPDTNQGLRTQTSYVESLGAFPTAKKCHFDGLRFFTRMIKA